MPIVSMKITSAAPHPNGEFLRVYTMEAPGYEPRQVIANLQNVYQVGDVVAVATIGTKFQDGLKIRKTKIRGVESFGMALGHVDLPPGQDISSHAEYNVVQEPAAT